MISRRTSTRFTFSVATILLSLGGAGFAISACSSSTTVAGTDTTEAGTDGGVDSSRTKVDAGPVVEGDAATPETSEQCFARCDKEHPAAVAKYDAVDTCWAASCKSSCVDQNGMFDAGGVPFGDGGVNDGGTNLCGTEVSSGVDRACDDCTEQNCCPSWTGCYNDQDCLAYNECVNSCP